MDVLVTSKNKEEPNKNDGASVTTTLTIDFSNTQGQITPRSEVRSGRNSNSSAYVLVTCQGSDLAEIQTHPRCYGYPSYFMEPKAHKVSLKYSSRAGVRASVRLYVHNFNLEYL